MDHKTDVKAGDGVVDWHAVTCRNYSLSEYHGDVRAPFSALISRREFGALMVSDVSASSQGRIQLVRGARTIRSDPRDQIMLFLVESGRVGLKQGDLAFEANAGDLFVYDQTRPFTLEFPDQHRGVMVVIPRAQLISRLRAANKGFTTHWGGESSLGKFARSVVRELVGLGGDLPANIPERLASSTLDILATTFDAQSAPEEVFQPRYERNLAKVKAYLLSHLDDVDISIDSMSRTHNMSPRTLNRLFAMAGTTPMRWLWQQRLAASYAALAEGRALSVTDAAMAFGFSDLSHFSRTFKLSFGKAPHELLRR
jgi:AraC-like DNA-binding protein